MNEDLKNLAEQAAPEPSEPAPGGGGLTHTEVRDAYARDPRAHPALLSHMNRLAAQEIRMPEDSEPVRPLVIRIGQAPADTLEQTNTWYDVDTSPDTMAEVEEDIEFMDGKEDWQTPDGLKLESYLLRMADYQGENAKTPVAAMMHSRIRQLIEHGAYTPVELNKFIGGMATYTEQGLFGYNDDMLHVLNNAPGHKLLAAYKASKPTSTHPSEHGAPGVYEVFDRLSFAVVSKPQVLSALATMYETDDALGLVDTEGEHQKDPIVRRFIAKGTFARNVVMADLLNPKLMNRAYTYDQDWGKRYLTKIAGLPPRTADDLLNVSYIRTRPEETQHVMPAYADMLINTETAVRDTSPETLQLAHDKAGILNLDRYTPEQLERTVKLLQGDPELISHLQAGDVIVVFTDAVGDHNGAFNNIAKTYETPSGRTLFFEVRKRAELNRYRVLLQKAGVRPSTVVFAAHGKPDTGMSYGGAGFSVNVRSDKEQSKDLELLHLEALPRLVDEWMQDSRGIDDNEQAKGRRRILLHSCSQAARRQLVVRTDKDGQTRFDAESTAEVLTRNAHHPRLDVYASDVPFGTQRTSHGMKLFKFQNDDGTGTLDKPTEATRLAMDSEGRMMELRTRTIELRKGAPHEETTRAIQRD